MSKLKPEHSYTLIYFVCEQRTHWRVSAHAQTVQAHTHLLSRLLYGYQIPGPLPGPQYQGSWYEYENTLETQH